MPNRRPNLRVALVVPVQGRLIGRLLVNHSTLSRLVSSRERDARQHQREQGRRPPRRCMNTAKSARSAVVIWTAGEVAGSHGGALRPVGATSGRGWKPQAGRSKPSVVVGGGQVAEVILAATGSPCRAPRPRPRRVRRSNLSCLLGGQR